MIDLTEPELARYASQDFMLLVAYAPVNVLYRLMRGTTVQFDEALRQARAAHQARALNRSGETARTSSSTSSR